MKTRAIFLGSVLGMSALMLWGCQFSTVDRASQYVDQYDASLPPVKDGGDASKPKPAMEAGMDEEDGGGVSDAGDGGNG